MKTIELITIFAMITTLMVTVVIGDPIDSAAIATLQGGTVGK
uniref:U19-MYRTX-Mri1a n=1 Tax=Manica rubida TaxID=219785 RepID=A0A6G9KJI8_MANRB|nr:U19-MYRTX-Mri1a precursor [Manica rubida]